MVDHRAKSWDISSNKDASLDIAEDSWRAEMRRAHAKLQRQRGLRAQLDGARRGEAEQLPPVGPAVYGTVQPHMVPGGL